MWASNGSAVDHYLLLSCIFCISFTNLKTVGSLSKSAVQRLCSYIKSLNLTHADLERISATNTISDKNTGYMVRPTGSSCGKIVPHSYLFAPYPIPTPRYISWNFSNGSTSVLDRRGGINFLLNCESTCFAASFVWTFGLNLPRRPTNSFACLKRELMVNGGIFPRTKQTLQ